MLRYEKEVYEYYKFLPMTHSPEHKEPSPESSQGHTQSMEELYGLECEPWAIEDYIQCQTCKRWFKNENIIKAHRCLIV
jgi:hypothetical protein